MTISALMYLLATVIFLLATVGVALGSVPMIPLGLTFTGAGLLFASTTFNRTVG